MHAPNDIDPVEEQKAEDEEYGGEENKEEEYKEASAVIVETNSPIKTHYTENFYE